MPPNTRRKMRYACPLVVIAFCNLAQGWESEIIKYPGAQATSIGGINHMGHAAGGAGSCDASVNPPVPVPPFPVNFLYDTDAGSFALLPPSAGYTAQPFANNDLGAVVGRAVANDCGDDPASVGFILNAQGYTTFVYHNPAFAVTAARGIGNSGLVTGIADTDGSQDNQVGFIYDPVHDAFTDIVFSGGTRVFAQGIDDAGEVIGSVVFPSAGSVHPDSPRGAYGYLRKSDGSTTLFRVNTLFTFARGINNTGLITGFVRIGTPPNTVIKGFVAMRPSGPGYQDVTVPDTQLFEVPGLAGPSPQAINDGFRIIGVGNDADGNQQSFVVTPSGTPLMTKAQAMNGDQKVAQGATLQAGYDFTMPGGHPAAVVGFLGTQVVFNATCASGTPGSKTIVVDIEERTYPVGASSTAWHPSGEQNNVATYQGSVRVPSFCDPGALVRLQHGGTFTTNVASTDMQHNVNIRWHYKVGTGGGWSGTYSVVGNM